jgi:hypothetical protein
LVQDNRNKQSARFFTLTVPVNLILTFSLL